MNHFQLFRWCWPSKIHHLWVHVCTHWRFWWGCLGTHFGLTQDPTLTHHFHSLSWRSKEVMLRLKQQFCLLVQTYLHKCGWKPLHHPSWVHKCQGQLVYWLDHWLVCQVFWQVSSLIHYLCLLWPTQSWEQRLHFHQKVQKTIFELF